MRKIQVSFLVSIIFNYVGATALAETGKVNLRVGYRRYVGAPLEYRDEAKAYRRYVGAPLEYRDQAPKKQPKVASRGPASADIKVTGEMPRAKEKDWSIALALTGGYSNAHSNDARTQAERDATGINRAGYLGLSLDLKAMKYTGFEIEGFYGAGRSGTSTSVDRVTGTISTNEARLEQYGGMAAFKGQLPVAVGRGWIAPKLGVGYGILGLRKASTDLRSAAQTETITDNRLSGPYATAGFDSELLPKVLLNADFAVSFAGKATTSSSVGGVDQADVDADSARYYRIRAGLLYRFTPNFTAGGQYNRRQYQVSAAGSDNATVENVDQFLGVIQVNF
jgi:hypothetical protein